MFEIKRLCRPIAMCAAVALLGFGAPAAASQWNEKTTLSFSEPVMIPGATLQPGSYVFELVDSSSTRQIVEIRNTNGSDPVTIALAVPAKRLDPNGNVVLEFEPTEAGEPPALKAWFFPGTLYGHEFVYPDEQAKEIAQRTKTIVLSVDVPGAELEEGTLRTYNASGAASEWHGDPAIMREWDEWQRGHKAQMAAARDAGRSSAPMIDTTAQGDRIALGALEENPREYIGKTVSVDAEIEHVFGPRIFTIDEPDWSDLDREVLVYVPSRFAAAVREDDRVTVTGEVKPFLRADVEHEWGWLGVDRAVEVRLANKPVLVASRIVGGNNRVAMVIAVEDESAAAPVGTSGRVPAPISKLSQIASGDESLVGRRVALDPVKVDRVADGGGFFASGQNAAVFVLPAHTDRANVQAGDTVSVHGVVMQMPDEMQNRLNAPAAAGDEIYVLGTKITG